jgi:hypothetical protein
MISEFVPTNTALVGHLISASALTGVHSMDNGCSAMGMTLISFRTAVAYEWLCL